MAKIKRSTSQARIGRNYYSFTVEELTSRPLSEEKRRRLESACATIRCSAEGQELNPTAGRCGTLPAKLFEV
jgi:hypothetical protein